MKNVLRTLVYDKQVSLTLADTTEMVRTGMRLHDLSTCSAAVFGRALSVMTFMSACLKGERGEISLSTKSDGLGGEIAVSGNRNLYLRGFISSTNVAGGADENSQKACFGETGSLTIIRDDGYSRPFVGACAYPENADVDSAFEEYFRISEQLPTRIKTTVEFDENGELVFAGIAVLQPLPFADEVTLEKVFNADMVALLQAIKMDGVQKTAEEKFDCSADVWEIRGAMYKCNCSRKYLGGVLVSLGEEQMREIIREDGAVRVHCHYCNTDYEFTDEDADKLFPKH